MGSPIINHPVSGEVGLGGNVKHVCDGRTSSFFFLVIPDIGS